MRQCPRHLGLLLTKPTRMESARSSFLLALFLLMIPIPFRGGSLEDAVRPGVLIQVNPLWRQMHTDAVSWKIYCRYVSHLSGVPFRRVAAMWAYETAFGASRLWKVHRNPAGIRHNWHAKSQGAKGVYSTDEGGTTKASYPSMLASAYNFAWTLTLRRYARCNAMSDDEAYWRCMRASGWYSGKNVMARVKLTKKFSNCVFAK